MAIWQGATFKPGKGSHFKVFLNGYQSILPMHNKELGTGLVNAIKKQLGLREGEQIEMRYPIELKPDGKFFLVTLVDIPEAITQGKNRKEGLSPMAAEALESALDFYFDDTRAVPQASSR